MRKIFGKAMRLGKTATLCVGLAVVLALTVGVATDVLAANGKPFILGRGNVATKVSSLIKQGVGPALGLKVAAGQPPLAVNAEAGTATNLSADELDGLDSGALQRRVGGECQPGSSIRSIGPDGAATCEPDDGGGKAPDSELLDGNDSSEFAKKASEPWRQVGAAGQPQFGLGLRTTPMWQNFDSAHNRASFYKDPLGIVHIRGVVLYVNNTGNTGTVRLACNSNNAVFTLPQGYRPAVREVLLTVGDDTPLRINVDANGGIYPCNETRDWTGGDYVSLDGISFRAEQ